MPFFAIPFTETVPDHRDHRIQSLPLYRELEPLDGVVLVYILM